MISNLWIAHRKENWSRLETLSTQAERDGVRSLGHAHLRELGLLYRQAAADLSAVRADHTAVTLEQYLNRLVGRAHNFVYRGNQSSAAGLWRFFAFGYPRVLRRLWSYVALATVIFVGAALLAAVMVSIKPAIGEALVGPAMMNSIDHQKMWTDSVLSAKPQASSGIMTNNISVCFYTFAGGILLGIPTLFLMFWNGFQIGVVATLCAQHHMALSLWSFVVSHGALELPSIMLAGGAGLRLADGVLFPGILRWKASVAKAGQDSVQLVAGTVPLLVVAGTLEAFLSPTHAPTALKFAVGSALFTALCWWLGRVGGDTVSAQS